jgi:arsenate reductase-like glutaredoxin family protein
MARLVSLIPVNNEVVNKKIQKEDITDIHASLPSQIKGLVDSLSRKVKSMNLSRDKEALVIAKLVDAMGMDSGDLNNAISRIKRAHVVETKNKKK